MPRKKAATPPEGQPKPVQAFQARLQRPVMEALAQAAARNGRSINAELADRLEKSFAQQEAQEWVWGGKRLLTLTQSWNIAFRYGGLLGAKAWGHPEWEADEWLDNPLCYRTARAAAADELDKRTPQIPGENAERFGKVLQEVAPHIARGLTLEAVLEVVEKKLEGEP